MEREQPYPCPQKGASDEDRRWIGPSPDLSGVGPSTPCGCGDGALIVSSCEDLPGGARCAPDEGIDVLVIRRERTRKTFDARVHLVAVPFLAWGMAHVPPIGMK
jgi:hypothetical protein